ncbi:hypothetical protein [Streptomyces sp. NPDC088246]|uniref:hypothetical protein n=1 Tax=Streptomyces sp. NPDC088246 TaxID=3365842 RepID=UPI0038293CC6
MEAAGEDKKVAKKGDVGGAQAAADEAQKHADDAADAAGLTGCTVGLGAHLRVP